MKRLKLDDVRLITAVRARMLGTPGHTAADRDAGTAVDPRVVERARGQLGCAVRGVRPPGLTGSREPW